MLIWLILGCNGSEKEPQPQSVEPAEEPIGLNPRLHRLTHSQWNNAIHDLLSIDATDMANQFLDAPNGEGFSNLSDGLYVDNILFQDYQRAAELLSTSVVSDLDLYAYVVPQDEREGGTTSAYSTRIEGEDGLGTTGAIYGERFNLWSNGTLSFELEIPNSGLYYITALVEGTQCDDDAGASMEIRLNGEPIYALHFSTIAMNQIWGLIEICILIGLRLKVVST